MSKTIFIIEDDLFLQGLEGTKLKKEGFDIKYSSYCRNSHTQIVAHTEKAGFNPIIKLKSEIPELKTAQFILDPSTYSGDTDYTIVLAD